MKKPQMGLKTWIICIFLAFFLPGAMITSFFTEGKDERYVKEGTLVEGTAVSVVRIRKHTYVKIVYQNEEGKEIEADFEGADTCQEGDKLTGYVLPGDPYKVVRPSTKSDMVAAIIITSIVSLMGWIVILYHFISLHNYNLLKKKGIYTKAKLMRTYLDEDLLFGYFTFMTQSGMQRTEKLLIPRKNAVEGKEYEIFYCEKPKGKCVAEVVDAELVR